MTCKKAKKAKGKGFVFPIIAAVQGTNSHNVDAAVRAVKSSAALADNLSALNTMRGGISKGFVFPIIASVQGANRDVDAAVRAVKPSAALADNLSALNTMRGVISKGVVFPIIASVQGANRDVDAAVRAVKSSATLADNLSALNTMRGGEKGFKGYVAEPFVAHDECISGKDTIVVNDNGPVDLVTRGGNGHLYKKQVKFSGKNAKIDFDKYRDQTVIVNKDRKNFNNLLNKSKIAKVKVVRSNVAEKDVKNVADAMQAETRISHRQNSFIIPKVVETKEVAKVLHNAGMKSAKTGVLFGSGFSIGRNAVKVLSGEKDISEAVTDVAQDTVVAGAVGYGTGVVGTAIASTSAGATVAGALSSAAAAVSGTTIGGAAVGAGTAAISAIGSAGAAAVGSAVGTVGAVGGAIGSAAVTATAGTMLGGAVASGVGAATAGAAALGAAAVAAAPVVAVGAVLGGLFSFFSD